MPGGQLAATLRVLRAVLRSPSLRRVMLAFLLYAAVEYGTWVAVLLCAYDALGPESVGAIAVIQLVPSAVFAAVRDRLRRPVPPPARAARRVRAPGDHRWP